MCNRQYGQTVPVQVYSHKNRSFSYIPSILRHILFELLKNSMRATVEVHEHDDELPPIKVIISDGDTNADVIMKISDEGGGIQRRNINRIWDYFYTTSTVNAFEKDGTDFGVGDGWAWHVGGFADVRVGIWTAAVQTVRSVLWRVAGDRVDRGVWDGCLFVLETSGRSSGTAAAVD